MAFFKDTLRTLLQPLYVAGSPLVWAHAVAVKLFTLLGTVAGLLVTLGAMLWSFVEFAGGLDSITSSIQNTSGMLSALPIAPVMNQVNRVFPLNELLVMEAVLLGIYLACMLVRWIKSFMPTVN